MTASSWRAFLKAKGFKGASLRTMLERLGHGQSETQLEFLGHEDPIFEADLAWQVRAWGRWVLARARKQLAPYYPTYAECVPVGARRRRRWTTPYAAAGGRC